MALAKKLEEAGIGVKKMALPDELHVTQGGNEYEVEHDPSNNTFRVYLHDDERRDTLGSDYDPEVVGSGLDDNEALYAVKGDY
jgi:hypothetical protein